MCIKEHLFKHQFSKMPKLLKFFITRSHKFNGYLHLKLSAKLLLFMSHECFYFTNLCFILKIFRWVYFFCDSTSKYLTSTYRVSRSSVGVDVCVWLEEEGGCSTMCNFFILQSDGLPTVLGATYILFGQNWKFKCLLIPF